MIEEREVLMSQSVRGSPDIAYRGRWDEGCHIRQSRHRAGGRVQCWFGRGVPARRSMLDCFLLTENKNLSLEKFSKYNRRPGRKEPVYYIFKKMGHVLRFQVTFGFTY